jgi:HEAT repeat protein
MRVAAAEGMGRLGRVSDVAALNGAFEKERKMEARLAAAFGAVALGNRGLAEFGPMRYLSNTLNSAAYAGVAQGYLEELCRGAEARRALIALMPAMVREEKSRMVRILASTGAPDVEDTLLALSKDPDVAVGQAAARALRSLRMAR